MNPNQLNQKPMQGQVNIPLDVMMSFENANCLNCGNSNFVPVIQMKKISPVYTGGRKALSPFNAGFMCVQCGNQFDPQEYEEHEKSLKEEKENIEENTCKIDKNENNREICRKCGEFYDKNEKHVCK